MPPLWFHHCPYKAPRELDGRAHQVKWYLPFYLHLPIFWTLLAESKWMLLKLYKQTFFSLHWIDIGLFMVEMLSGICVWLVEGLSPGLALSKGMWQRLGNTMMASAASAQTLRPSLGKKMLLTMTVNMEVISSTSVAVVHNSSWHQSNYNFTRDKSTRISFQPCRFAPTVGRPTGNWRITY